MNTAAGSLRSNTPRELLNIGIPALVVMAIVFNVFAFIFALRWSQAPFLAVFLYPKLVTTDHNNPAWQAHQTDLQPGDRLLAIDDTPISSGRDLYLFLSQKETNDSLSLKIERVTAQDEPLSITFTVSLSKFKWSDLFIFFWLPFLIGLLYLALGIIVYRLRGTEQDANIFLVLCILVSVLAGSIFDQNTLHFLTPIRAIAFPLTGAALLHLALVFPTPARLSRRKPWLALVPYGVALILGSANIYSFYYAPDPRLYLTIRFWNWGLIWASMSLFLALQLHARLTTITSLVRQQTAIVIWGSIIAFVPAAGWALANGMDMPLPFGWPVFAAVYAPLIVFPVAIAYAMLRYQLLDLDLVFSRGAVYTLLSLLVVVVYLLIVSLLGVLFQDSELFDNPLILAIFVVVLVIALDPLKQSMQAVVNRLFFREPFDYRQLLGRYGRALISTPLHTDHILEMLTTYAGEAVAPDLAVVFLRDATQGVFAVRYPTGGTCLEIVEVRFGLSDDLARWLADTNNILQLAPDGTTPSQVNIAGEELARLKMLNITLCVPLLGSEHLLGWLALGLKKSGHPYMSDDLLFLATLASQTAIALENAQLLEEANRRAIELETLQKISVDIQSQAEPDTLLASVVDRATKLLKAEGGLVLLLEPDNKTLKVVVSHNLDRDYTNYTLEVPEDIAGRVVTLDKSVLVDHYHNFSGRSRKFQKANFGAVLGVPLRWAGTVRGVLYLIHQPGGLRFSEDDIWLMELFATQSAIALEQSRLLQDARGVANQLTVLSEVSTAISATLDLDETLLRILNGAVEILNAEAGSLLLVDSTGKALIFEVVLGPTGEELLGETIPVGKGIVGTVAQTGEPLIINDVTTDSRWDYVFDRDTDFETKDLLCVPMISRERLVGVVEILNKQGGVFDQDDCGLLMAFGAQAAVAIENAQRFARTDREREERVQELHTLQMFDHQLQTSLQLNTVLDTTLTYAMDALGVSIGLLAIFIKEADEPGLYLLAQRGLPMEMGRYKKDPWPLTRGVLGRVAQTGQAELCNDISQAKDYMPKTHRTRSLLVVPIMREGRVIGVIDLESTEPDYFTEDDLSFVNILVSHSAFAIENAQLFRQVDQANQAKSEFMNTASHELKIPMTSIKGYAKLLQMGTAGPLTDQQEEFLEVISNNVNRMDRLVANLLDVSRIEAGRIRLELQNVQMSRVINDVIGSVRTQIDKKSLNLNLQVDDDLPEIRADYGRMVQIVTNLVSNAYKYTPAGGDITVKASPHNGDVKGIAVTVKDTGYGISEEDQANLFTTFFRSSDQNIREEMGTGLGLSITKKMIESHGGRLTFESKYGQGTTFTFTIPLVSEIPAGVEVIER